MEPPRIQNCEPPTRYTSRRREPKPPNYTWAIILAAVIVVLGGLGVAIGVDEYRRQRDKQEAKEVIEQVRRDVQDLIDDGGL